ncbi:MAG: MAE_28990/MAE_18760 family HEPN-like nuclease [Sulfurovum sp.]|nr:MAE_28990/MAE_18760 family HEPN-like nuclease [Sulfurovum sp.]
MEFVVLEFEEKVEEINEYFSFIKRTTHLRLNSSDETIQVSETVHQILKSNLFLLLYNLVESSFKNALENICISITNDDELKYQKVIPKIKEIWINKEYKKFGEKCILPRDTEKSTFLINKIDTIAQEIIKLNFTNTLSGNVTPPIIKESINEYGLETHDVRNPSSLFIIKNKRNNLAHGNETFSQCGRAYSIVTLEEIKNESINYMRFILEHIKDFIDEKKYKI